jgi:phosphoribosyl-AMP cyclohydrolase
MTIPNEVVFNEQGLIPVVAQDHVTGRVLMVAYMNRDALDATLTTGRAVYYSRSRGELWRKGDTSGHAQFVRRVALDCDGDALLITVEQVGPACHTGSTSCFDTSTIDATTDAAPDDSASSLV